MFFSVIVPVYNTNISFLEKCFVSLSSQKTQNTEYIIVDDGSDSLVSKFCDQFSITDNRFKIFHIAHSGVSEARNYGIEVSSGDYIIFVDADDALLTNALEIINSDINNTNADIYLFGYNEIKNNSDIILNAENICSSAISHNCNILDIAWNIIALNEPYDNYCLGSPWGKVFSRNFIIRNNIYFPKDISYSEDRLFLIKLLAKQPRIYAASHKVYAYFIRDSSLSRSFDISIIDRYYDAYLGFKNVIHDYFDSNPFLLSALPYAKIHFFENYIRILLSSRNKNIFQDFLIFKNIFFKQKVEKIDTKKIHSKLGVFLFWILYYVG